MSAGSPSTPAPRPEDVERILARIVRRAAALLEARDDDTPREGPVLNDPVLNDPVLNDPVLNDPALSQ